MPADRPTVLVADDEPSVRLLVTETIAAYGYNIVEASDGDEAWNLIRQYRPALALLDIRMPGRTGLELLRSIKEDHELAGTKVILLTASAAQSEVNAGIVAGADFYLTKPFSPRELLARVDEAIAL